MNIEYTLIEGVLYIFADQKFLMKIDDVESIKEVLNVY